ncbi:Alpha/Beta hydrolase protein [Fusarium avenaceum]|nr:Alpha/Beta hydrolase protein [Fusarium avenaceum]
MVLTKPVIIFVPGAFVGPGPYAAVAECLRVDGYTVEVVHLPSAADLSSETVSSPKWKSLAEKTAESDIEAIHNVVKPHFVQGRQIVLIGHSYGSIPAMLSIEGHTAQERETKGLKGGVVAYINIAGFAFGARGKNVMGTEEDPSPMPYHKFEDGVVTLQETAKPLFFGDMSPEKQDEVWPTFPKQQSWGCFYSRPSFIDTDVKIPKAYFRTEKDECVVPQWQDGFIAAGQYEVVVPLTTGHCPMVSQPQETARAIVKFVSDALAESKLE